MGTEKSVKLCREKDTRYSHDLMNRSSRFSGRVKRVKFQSENLDIAASSPPTIHDEKISIQWRPSERVITFSSDEEPTYENILHAPNRRRKTGKRASQKRSKVGPTAPKPEPTIPPDVLPGKIKKKKWKKKNKWVGPTRPEDFDVISDEELYESSVGSSRTDSASSSESKKIKNSMSGWNQEWGDDKVIAGLNVDEKSESDTTYEEHRIFVENGQEVDKHELFKYPRTSIILPASRLHKDLKENDDDEREYEDTISRVKPKLILVVSSKSDLSDLSAAPTVMSKSAKSNASDFSYMSDANIRLSIGATQRLPLQTPYISDLMPRPSWHSPHYKDYEEEPYDMHTGRRQRKGSRNSERFFFK